MKKQLAALLSILLLLNSSVLTVAADETKETESAVENQEETFEENKQDSLAESETEENERSADEPQTESDFPQEKSNDSESEIPSETDVTEILLPENSNVEEKTDKNDFPADTEEDRRETKESDPSFDETESASLLASGEAVYYGEYGIWFNSVTHTVTKGANRTSITIPSEIDGYVVSAVADYAFQNCYWLKTISIPATVTTLGSWTFRNCTSLQSITIPKTVTSGRYLFEGCTNLKEVSFAAGTKSIPSHILKNSPSVEKINLPVGLLKIGDYAFSDCPELSNITLPATLTDMGQYTFKNCTALIKITIPRNVTSGSCLFNGCTNLTDITFSAGTKSIPGKFLYESPAVETVNLPNGLMTIGDQAFAYCYNLKDIVLPSSITDLGEKTFYQCKSLKSLTIPQNVTAGSDLFQYCTNLKEIIFAVGIKTIPDGFLRSAYNVEKVVLPEGLLTIGDQAFRHCYSLKSITFPTSLTNFGFGSFFECISLETVTIPKNVASGQYVFKKCTNLKKVIFSPGTRSIPQNFLEGAYNVEQVVLPDSLLSIGDYAFYDCYNLKGITIPSSVTTLGRGTFHGCVSLKTFTIPKNVKEYSDLFNQCTGLTEIIFEQGTVSIPDRAVRDTPSVESIVIPDGVVSIGSDAFSSCSNLKSIVIPDTVTNISDYPFSDCYALKEVTFPANAFFSDKFYRFHRVSQRIVFAEGTTGIPGYMFSDTEAPFEVYLPKSISEIPETAFVNAYFVKLICNNEYAKNYAEEHSITYEYNGKTHDYGINTNTAYVYEPPEIGTYYEKYKLYFDKATGTITGVSSEAKDLVIPERIDGVKVERIGDSAFEKASNLTSVSMPNTILAIGRMAFYDCIRLKSVVFSNGLYSMGNNAFYNCVSLKEVFLPSTLSECGSDYALWFQNCQSLKKIVLEEGTTRILPYAFSSIPSLETVVIPDSVTEIGEYAFQNCSNLKNVELPQELYSMGRLAFLGCAIEKITIPSSLTEGTGPWFSSCNQLREITLSDGLTKIPEQAFASIPLLESIVIPDTVTKIDLYAFSNCLRLKNVTLSKNLMTMEYRVFLNCPSLQEIIIPSNLTDSSTDSTYHSGYWFEDCYSLKKVIFEEGATIIPQNALSCSYGLHEVYLPNTLSEIGDVAFGNCISLSELNLPKSVLSIGGKAFVECRSLRNITIPLNVKNTPSSYLSPAFENCTGLESVTFAAGIKEIPSCIFYDMYSLKRVTLPESITQINSSAFHDCISLEIVDYAGSPISFKNIAIESGNEPLLDAAIICQKKNPDTTRESIRKTVTLYVETNLNTAASGNDNYVKSTDVIATIGKNTYRPDENGKFELPANGTAVFSADRYVSKSVSLASVSNGTMIRLELKNDKDPIIHEVMLEAVNIRSQTYKMSADYKGTIYASVNWNGCKEKAFYIENGNNIWKITDNKTDIIEFGNLINTRKKIYITAVTANGQTYRKELHIEVEKVMPPENMNLNIGASMPEVSADSIPHFGKEFKFKLDIPNFKGSVSIKGDTATYIFGVDVEKYAKSKNYYLYDEDNKKTYNETTTEVTMNAFDDLTSIFKNTFAEMKRNRNDQKALNEQFSVLQKRLKGTQKSTTGKFGVDANFNVCGFAKIKYKNVNGKPQGTLMEGGVIFSIEAKASISGEFIVLWVVPFNWEAGVSGSLKAQLEIARSEIEEALRAQGVINGEIGIKVGAGPGFKDVHVNGCGEGKLKLIVTSSPSEVGVKADVEFAAYLEFYAFGNVGKLNIANKTWNIYPKPSKAKSADVSLMEAPSLYDENNFEPIGRDYLDKYPSEFVANNETAVLMDEFTRTDSTIKTNVYPNASPVMAMTRNGNKLLVWLEDNTARNSANSSTLTYSYYTNGSWSEPEYVDDDGTADFKPVLKTVNGTTYLAWENAKTAVSDEMSITETAKLTEIQYAIFDTSEKTFKNITALTDNEYIDSAPVINSTKLGTVISWVTNEGDEYFTADSCHGISYALVDMGDIKESGRLAENLSAIDSQLVYTNNGKLEAMYIVDTDGNLETNADNALCTTAWPYEKLLEGTVSGISEWFGDVYCYKDNSLFMSSDNLNFYDMGLAVPNGNFLLADNANIVLFEQSHDGAKDIYAYFYSDNSWSDAVQITDLHAVLGNLTAYMNYGKLELAFMKGILSENTENPQYFERSDIGTMTVSPSYDISLDGVFLDKATLVPGKTAELVLDVRNSGENKVRSVDVSLYNGTEEILGQTIYVSILPGQTREITVDYSVPSNFKPFNADIEISVTYCSDRDPSNNKGKVNLSYTDLSLGELTYSKVSEEEWDINTAVSNLGFDEMKNIQIILKDENGESVDSKTIESLKALETQGVVFKTKQSGVEYTVEIVATENEDNIANNIGTVEIPGVSAEPEYILGDLNGDEQVDIEDAILLFRHSMLPDLYPIEYLGSIDFNHDDKVDIDDAILLFQHSMLPDLYPIE